MGEQKLLLQFQCKQNARQPVPQSFFCRILSSSQQPISSHPLQELLRATWMEAKPQLLLAQLWHENNCQNDYKQKINGEVQYQV
jgi:hypothetical protein